MYTSFLKSFRLCILMLSCASAVAGQGTGDSTRYLKLRDSIVIYNVENGIKVFDHLFNRKQTLYSLARFYGISVEELYLLNPGLRTKPIETGQRIRVPIPHTAIRRYRKGDFKRWKFVSAYYKVAPGDDLKKIADVHFRIKLDTLIMRNHLTNKTVTPGQLLHIGYVSVEGIPDSLRKPGGGNADDVKYTLALNQFKEESKKVKLKEERGPALWPKNVVHPKGEELIHEFFVLHRTATLNSTLEITNPATGQTAYAKVIGRIPNIYPDKIILISSVPLAKTLGVLDERFFVKIRYY